MVPHDELLCGTAGGSLLSWSHVHGASYGSSEMTHIAVFVLNMGCLELIKQQFNKLWKKLT
jgi:hypothetical protein